MGAGRRTREEIVKWNQMKALRFQIGGRHQTSLASLQGISWVILQRTAHSPSQGTSLQLCLLLDCTSCNHPDSKRQGRTKEHLPRTLPFLSALLSTLLILTKKLSQTKVHKFVSPNLKHFLQVTKPTENNSSSWCHSNQNKPHIIFIHHKTTTYSIPVHLLVGWQIFISEHLWQNCILVSRDGFGSIIVVWWQHHDRWILFTIRVIACGTLSTPWIKGRKNNGGHCVICWWRIIHIW